MFQKYADTFYKFTPFFFRMDGGYGHIAATLFDIMDFIDEQKKSVTLTWS